MCYTQLYCLVFYACFVISRRFLGKLAEQYYWFIYPDTSQSVVMLIPQPCAPRRAAIATMFKVLINSEVMGISEGLIDRYTQ